MCVSTTHITVHKEPCPTLLYALLALGEQYTTYRCGLVAPFMIIHILSMLWVFVHALSVVICLC